ncbi:MAG: EthD family reductase [Actinomycetota bacterium]|nr:EthD family reductase [Actinomycetota bacterium]
MPKVVCVARDSAALDALEALLCEVSAKAVVYRADEPGTLLAVACLWLDRPDLVLAGRPLPCYLVEERVQIDGNLGPGAVVQVSLVHRLPDASHGQFAEHWSSVHAPLARRHHPGLVRYVQNVVVAALTPGAGDLDGVAELGFGDERDLHERRYDSPEGRAAVGRDVARFIDVPAGERLVARLPFASGSGVKAR